MSFLEWLAVILLAGLVALIFYWFRAVITAGYHRFERPRLITSQFEAELVYLYKFPDNDCCINVSPFCVKLEFFLRYHRIRYQPVVTAFAVTSPEGKKPFIELNGEQYGDTDLIINTLSAHFRLRNYLTADQRALSNAVAKVCDKSMYFLNLYSKLENNLTPFVRLIIGSGKASRWRLTYIRPIVYYYLWQRVKNDGTGWHVKSEVEELLRQDLEGVERLLGDKAFVCGSEAGLGDFALFAHLVCAYHLPYEVPLRKILNERCPRLKLFMERIAETYFADYKLYQEVS